MALHYQFLAILDWLSFKPSSDNYLKLIFTLNLVLRAFINNKSQKLTCMPSEPSMILRQTEWQVVGFPAFHRLPYGSLA